jgi:hypothetical protein
MAIYFNQELKVGENNNTGVGFDTAKKNNGQTLVYNATTGALSGSWININWTDTVGLNGVHTLSGTGVVDGALIGRTIYLHTLDKQAFSFTVAAGAAFSTQTVTLTSVGRTVLSKNDVRKRLLGY